MLDPPSSNRFHGASIQTERSLPSRFDDIEIAIENFRVLDQTLQNHRIAFDLDPLRQIAR